MNQSLEKVLSYFPVECDVMKNEHFRNEKSENFSETPAFRPKPIWKPPKGHASLEVFLSRLEKELFSNEINEPMQSNLSGEE